MVSQDSSDMSQSKGVSLELVSAGSRSGFRDVSGGVIDLFGFLACLHI